MERIYQNTAIYFTAMLLIIVWGFYRTYFGLFPGFNGITTVQHVHGILFLLWFGFLISQPLLIKYGKASLHRSIGKLSYLLVPMIMLSIFFVSKLQFQRMAALVPREQNLGGMALNIPVIFAFGGLYALAMLNRKRPALHMRYMIATSFLLLGPAIGRAFIIYGGMPFPKAATYAILSSVLLSALFLTADIIGKKPVQPYLTALCITLFLFACWQYQMAGWWQSFAAGWAALFF